MYIRTKGLLTAKPASVKELILALLIDVYGHFFILRSLF